MALFKGKKISELPPLTTDEATLLAGQSGSTTGSVTVQSIIDLVPVTEVNLATKITGPTSSVDSEFVQFDGTTGKLAKGGIALTTSTSLAGNSNTSIPSEQAVKTYVDTEVAAKQDVLISGTNIKTVNNTSLLGSGNIDIDLSSKQDVLISGTNIKTVNNTSLLGSGNIALGSSPTNVLYDDILPNTDTEALILEGLLFPNSFAGSGSLTFTRPAGVLIVNGQRVEVPEDTVTGAAPNAEYMWDVNLTTFEVVRTYYTFDNSVPYVDPAVGYARFMLIDTDGTEAVASAAWVQNRTGFVTDKAFHFLNPTIKLGTGFTLNTWGDYESKKITLISSSMSSLPSANPLSAYNTILINSAATVLGTESVYIAAGQIGGTISLADFNQGQNVSIGHNSFKSVNHASGCVALGNNAMENRSGTSNVAVGFNAFKQAGPQNGSNDTSNNVVIGAQAGLILTIGNNNTLLGYQAETPTATTSNNVVLGNGSVTTLRCAATSITSLSDERDKTDIIDIPLGLDFINGLRPVKFTWNTRDMTKVGIPDAGFIAQELKLAEDTAGVSDWLKLVCEVDPNKLNATPGRILPVLVKAVQELSAKVEALETQLANL